MEGGEGEGEDDEEKEDGRVVAPVTTFEISAATINGIGGGRWDGKDITLLDAKLLRLMEEEEEEDTSKGGTMDRVS